MADDRPSNPTTPVSGDAALEDSVRRYLPVVYAAARRQLPDASLAEDVTQAVFVVLARRHSGLPANVVLSSWLLKVTHLACLQARRNAGRRRRHERKAAQMRPATTSAESMTPGLLAAEMDAALARLREADRSVLTLRYLEEQSVAEVAQRLGISGEAAQKRIDRAMARLRQRLGVTQEQLGAASLGAFFLSQKQVAMPAHLAAKVMQSIAAGGTAVASTTATLITQGVLKALFWSGLKVPLIAGVIVLALAAGTLVIENALSRNNATRATALSRAPQAALIDRTRAASSNVPGADYPRLDGRRRATFRIYAPEALAVAVQIGSRYDMTRGDDGYWSVTTSTLAPGFHYYQFFIDGAAVADPGSRAYFGGSKMTSGLEVPEPGVDFYRVKDVPHGEIRARYYQSASTNRTRQAFVYTPPGYDANRAVRYPVLYLLHGMGEDQRAWVEQGHVDAILDNLIADGKAPAMIVVMEDAGTGGGYAARGNRQARTRARGGSRTRFPQIFISETIPMVDATYRTIADREHRAMAGVSLGGTQTFQITQDHLDLFSYIGSFSAPFGYPAVPAGYGGLLGSPGEFAQEIKVLYISIGGTENNIGARMFHQQLDGAGIPHVYYEAPGTANGWQTWRKSLYEFAQLLFKD